VGPLKAHWGRAAGLLLSLAGCAGPHASSLAGASPTDAHSTAPRTAAARSGSAARKGSSRQLSPPLAPRGAEICFNATDDNGNGLLEEGCAIEQGDVQFLVAWHDGDVDVDLHVTGPSGETAAVGTRTRDGLTKIRDCPGEGQECQDRNQENVVLDGSEAAPGRYLVRVRLEDMGAQSPPVRVRLGTRSSGKTEGFLIELWDPGSEALVWVHHVREPGAAKRP